MIFKKKKFLRIYVPFFIFRPTIRVKGEIEARWTTPWNLKGVTQPLNNQPKLITQEELHKLASKTVGSAKKIYVHYTPQEGAMVLKFLF